MTADFKQGANLAGKLLASGRLTTNGVITVYTVPASSAAKIATFAVCNRSSSSTALITISVVPSGQSVDETRVVVSVFPLDPNDSTKIIELEGAFLGAGDFITIKCDPGNVLNYTITGAVSS